jgi:hypothetical protein
MKHGIFSKATLVKGESRSKYRSLLEGLRKSWQPATEAEELQIDKMASISWRYQRSLLAEGAEIRKNSLDLINQEAPAMLLLPLESDDDPIGIVDDPDELEHCLELLADLREGIETNGFNEEHDVTLLKLIYGEPDRWKVTLHLDYMRCLSTSGISEEEGTLKRYAIPEKCKEIILQKIDAETIRLKQDHKKRASMASEQRKINILRELVPDSQALDRILRYQSSLERAFDRAMIQLERLQRIRKGQPLPPQLDVKIS